MPSEQMMLISALKPFPRNVEKFHDTISIFDFSKKGLGPITLKGNLPILLRDMK